jgi:hypothetical protein
LTIRLSRTAQHGVCTGAGGDHGMEHPQNPLRFPYVSEFGRSHDLHPYTGGGGCSLGAASQYSVRSITPPVRMPTMPSPCFELLRRKMTCMPPAPSQPPSIFRDKNRGDIGKSQPKSQRDIGRSQSKRPPRQRWQRRAHVVRVAELHPACGVAATNSVSLGATRELTGRAGTHASSICAHRSHIEM